MLSRNACRVVCLAALLAAAGCEAEKSRNPLSPDVAGPIPGVEISAAKPLEPIGGVSLRPEEQPVVLLFENAWTTGERPLWHKVQISSDAGFSTTLYEADRLTPGDNGRTTHRLPDTLDLGRTYYWRVRAEDGANTGPYSEAAHFQMLEPVVLGVPQPVSPVGGTTTTTNRPDFVVTNGSVSGPAGPVIYRFEVSTSQAFTSLAAVMEVPRSGGSTTTATPGPLPNDMLFYWRVLAFEPTTKTAYSSVHSFRTPSVSAPPPFQPPPPPGNPTQLTPANMFSFLQHYSVGHPDWQACQAGSDVGCFRFVYSVGKVSNPSCNPGGWGVLRKNPGEWQCTLQQCGPISGGFGEDVLVYGQDATSQPGVFLPGRAFDVVVGAGGVGASLGYFDLSAHPRRDGNTWICPW